MPQTMSTKKMNSKKNKNKKNKSVSEDRQRLRDACASVRDSCYGPDGQPTVDLTTASSRELFNERSFPFMIVEVESFFVCGSLHCLVKITVLVSKK